MYLCLLGILFTVTAPGSWARECELFRSPWSSSSGPYDVLGWVWIALYTLNTVYALRSLWKRVALEDEELRKKFGPEWEEYRRRVRWGIIPGIH